MQTGIFPGFPLLFTNFTVYLYTFDQCVFNMHVCNTKNSLNIRREEQEDEDFSTVEKNKKIYEEKNKKE